MSALLHRDHRCGSWHAVLIASCLLLTVLPLSLTVAPATALAQAARAPRPLDSSATVTVPATVQWVNTGIVVNSGDNLAITAAGAWTPGPPQTAMVGPDGSTIPSADNFLNLQDIGVCSSCATTPTPHWAALIGYIGGTPPAAGSYTSASILPDAQQVFVVGSTYNATASQSGELWLAFNDDAYSDGTGDNAGQVTAQITDSAPACGQQVGQHCIAIWTDQTQYTVGDMAQVCYSVAQPSYVVIINIAPDGTSHVILQGNDNGSGGCFSAAIAPPPGQGQLHLAVYADSSQSVLLGSADAFFTVLGPTDTPTDTPTNTPIDTPTTVATDTPTDTPTNTPTDTPAAGGGDWVVSPVWTGDESGPQDANGRAWYDPSFDDSSWSAVTLPDQGSDGNLDDRYYRSHFTWDGTSSLSVHVASDDGVTVYVNGTLVGSLGNGWRQEGCVNMDTFPTSYFCNVEVSAPDLSIPASVLRTGADANTIAIDLSNGACCSYALDLSLGPAAPPTDTPTPMPTPTETPTETPTTTPLPSDTPNPACTEGTSLTPSSGPPGSVATLDWHDDCDGGVVSGQVFFDGQQIATFTTDANEQWSGQITIPLSAQDGVHTISAQDDDGSSYQTTSFTVFGAPTDTPVPPDASLTPPVVTATPTSPAPPPPPMPSPPPAPSPSVTPVAHPCGAGASAPPLCHLRLFFTTDKSIQIGWSDNAQTETGIQVEYRPADKAGAAWSKPVQLKAHTTTWWHNKLKTGASYEYRVRACDGSRCANWAQSQRDYNGQTASFIREWARRQWDDATNFTHLDYGLYWFRCGTCRGNGQSDGQWADPSETATGQHDAYFDPTKPTVIYVHGWQPGSVQKRARESMSWNPTTGYVSDVDLMRHWKSQGWNVGIFYWNQFADDDPGLLPHPPSFTEPKIWTPTSTQVVSLGGHGGHKAIDKTIDVNMRWRQVDGTFTQKGSPKKAVADLFLDAYRADMTGYTGNDIRIVGHSLGAQVAIRMVWLLTQHPQKDDAALLPRRVALLDPYWTSTQKADTLASMMSDIKGKDKDPGVTFEYYKTTILAPQSSKVEAQAVFVRLYPTYAEAGWDLLDWPSSMHTAAIYWYFQSMGYTHGQPPELTCARRGPCHDTGQAAPSAGMADDALHTLMVRAAYQWTQRDGDGTPDLTKDTFARRAKLGST